MMAPMMQAQMRPMMQGHGGMTAQQNGPKQGVPGDNRIYIFGIPPGLNADHLRGHFNRDGEIYDIHMPPRKPDNAYITFATAEAVHNALAGGLNIAGYMVQGIKEAMPKDNV